jgi:DNA-binding protein HU-beta
MTKNELPRRQVIEFVDAMLERITQVLKSGDKVQLTPFGQFKVRDRPARVARNPQTGAPVNVPAKRVLKFIAGRSLKEAVGTAKRGAKKAAAKKGPAKKTAAKKAAPAKKAAVKKASAIKSPVRKTPAKKKR